MKIAYRNVPVREDTYERLKAYKMGGATFDEVVNDLMNHLPLEKVSAKELRLHKRRMKTFRGQDWKEVRDALGDR